MRVWDWLWPTLEGASDVETAQQVAQTNLDIATVKAAEVSKDVGVLIDEARRLTDAESDRGKVAETRATTYLAIVGVLAPILATVTPVALSAEKGVVKAAVTLGLFVAAGAYLFWSGSWAFRALRVSVSARLDAVDLIAIWKDKDPQADLAKGLLTCVRMNRATTNLKVSCIKMAHEFGLRAFATFVAALIIRSAWDPVVALAKLIL